MASTAAVHIGTSGWHYAHWRGPFYPAELSPIGFLEFYTGRFHTAEINNTFYRLPPEKTFAGWRDSVPEGFVFAVKASGYITHRKKLADPETTLSTFTERIEALGDKLGPVLFQLPPKWRLNAERLRLFLEALPSGLRCAFEFRDPSWFDAGVERLLADSNAAFCIYDLAGFQSPRTVTADFVYLRLHGPGGAYQGEYGEAELSPWAEAISGWTAAGREVFCYFDNDQAGYAPRDALRLISMLERR